MLIYQCRFCKTIWEFPSPPPLSECKRCQGGLVYLDTHEHLNKIQGDKTNEKKGRINYKFLLSLFKGVGITWGTVGAVNIVVKSIKKENIGKGDLYHTLLPWATTGTIHGFQQSKELKNLFFSAQPQTGMKEKLQKVIEIIKRQQSNKDSQDLPKVAPEKKVNFQFEPRETLTKQTQNAPSKNMDQMGDPRAFKWLRILSTRPRILILGGQGTGKSALAFWLLEILHTRCPCFVYRLPDEGVSSIPPWLGIIHDLNDAPLGSVVLVDEAYLSFFSRESQSKQNRELTKMVNLSRQKNLGLIFVAHEARHIDKNILSCIDTLVVKRPAPLQVALDRSFLRTYLLRARSVFHGKSDASSKSASYVGFSPTGFEGVLDNPRPSFWSEKLSHIFASGNLSTEERPARELSKDEKRKRAQKLRDDSGYSYGDIAKDLGMGKTTIYRWLNEDGTKR